MDRSLYMVFLVDELQNLKIETELSMTIGHSLDPCIRLRIVRNCSKFKTIQSRGSSVEKSRSISWIASSMLVVPCAYPQTEHRVWAI